MLPKIVYRPYGVIADIVLRILFRHAVGLIDFDYLRMVINHAPVMRYAYRSFRQVGELI